MSTFKVAVEKIAKVTNHPNADRLDIAELEGMTFQFVVGRGQYRPGDLVVYLPVDAIVPAAVTDQLGLTGKLSGRNKDRVKTIKLRGEISQGVVGPLSLLQEALIRQGDHDAGDEAAANTQYHDADGVPVDFSALLGITKYAPPEPGEQGTPGARRERTLPAGVLHYDIEGCDRYKAAIEQMLDWPVLVTEKLEGSHTAITRYPDGRVVVASRNHALVRPDDIDTCRWHAGCRNSGLFDAVEAVAANYGPATGKQVTLRGELLGPGVQDNIYRLTQHWVVLFEVEVDGVPLCGSEFMRVAWSAGLPIAPVLNKGVSRPGQVPCAAPTLREWLAGRTVREASTGPSALFPAQLREGIVIRPWLPEHEAAQLRGLGRPILKQRSPEYLAKSEL